MNPLSKAPKNIKGTGTVTSSAEEKSTETNTFYISTERQGTIKVVEYFHGSESYDDIIRAALRREFAE